MFCNPQLKALELCPEQIKLLVQEVKEEFDRLKECTHFCVYSDNVGDSSSHLQCRQDCQHAITYYGMVQISSWKNSEFIWQTFYSNLIILTMGRSPYYTWKKRTYIMSPLAWILSGSGKKSLLEALDGSKHSHNARLHIQSCFPSKGRSLMLPHTLKYRVRKSLH